MPKPDPQLPLQRSYVEQRIGQLVGIFEIDRKATPDGAETRSLPSADGMVGLVAVADGGRLTETAFNVWTVGSQMFKESGCPDSNRIDFNLTDYARRLWGANARSGSLRKRVTDAISELLKTNVVVVGVDPYTLNPTPDAVWELSLLEAAGVRGSYGPVFEAARDGDKEAIAKLAALSNSADSEKATWSIVLPKWLADSVRRDQGVILDYDVQRTLRGAAKRIWVQLETYSDWQSYRLARPCSDSDLRALVKHLLTSDPAVTVEPAPDEEEIEIQVLKMPLTNDVYDAFGLRHQNRKRALENACENIVLTDLTYLHAKVVPSAHSKRLFELHVARAAGSLRQERHRTALRLRHAEKTSTPQEAAA